MPVFGQGTREALINTVSNYDAWLTAEARERQAEAEAKATYMVSEAIAKGDLNAINYFVANKYVEALQTIGSADNQKVLFLPIEATGVIGSIGGIAEIAKQALSDKAKSE